MASSGEGTDEQSESCKDATDDDGPAKGRALTRSASTTECPP